jgi:hypothetical protein
MDSVRERAIQQFPAVLITLLSIIQALALEFLWSHLHQRPDLYEFGWPAIAGWLQIAATFNGLILIWLVYSGTVMRFRWTPTMGDSMLPFFVGLTEFLMIDLMGPENIGRWFLVLAVIFAAMIVGNHRTMARARRDPANQEFFATVAPATRRDFLPHSIGVMALVIVGAGLWSSGNQGWLALFAFLGSVLMLAGQTYNAAAFWNRSMGVGK